MKIAITGGKGGTGKSTVASSLAVEFARDRKTMLVDADAECPNDHLVLSVDRKEEKKVYQLIPKWDLDKCTKCGKCAEVCKQDAIIFVKDKYPAFVSDKCIGCGACKISCPSGAISDSRKEIGTLYTGRNYGVELVSGELKIGELASGEVVAEVRKFADEYDKQIGSEIMLIDSAAGVGCPVIASLVGTDYIVAVTEPTPSALHDLKRVMYLAKHFDIQCGIVINKYDLADEFCKNIEDYAESEGLPIIGRIPYRDDFVKSTIEMKPAVELFPEYRKIFQGVIHRVLSNQ